MEVTAEQAREQVESSEDIYNEKIKAAGEEILKQARSGKREAWVETYDKEIPRFDQMKDELKKAGFAIGAWHGYKLNVSW